MSFVKLYIIALVLFLAIDGIWLGLIAKNLYQQNIGHLMSDSIKFAPALLFYLVYVVGIIVLAVQPGIDANSLGKTLMLAALFGFLAYGTYDFTNWATLKDWPAKIVLIDVLWGTFVTSTTAGLTWWLSKLIG